MAKRKPKNNKQDRLGNLAKILRATITLAFFIGLILSIGALFMRHLVFRKLSQRAISSSSVLYSRPISFSTGTNLNQLNLQSRLSRLGYRKINARPSSAGEYYPGLSEFNIYLKGFSIAENLEQKSRLVSFELDSSGEITKIIDEKTSRPIRHAWLEPELLSALGTSDTRVVSPRRLNEFGTKLAKAIISIEDERFYSHFGIDPTAIARAIYTNIKAGSFVQGGSTITQQLVKNLLLTSERSFLRKLLEIPAAIFIETSFSKDKILEFYLNEIFLAQEGRVAIHGFGEAAKNFFGKEVSELSWAQTATLAGIVKAPSAYSPRKNPKKAIKRRNLVLNKMKELKYISDKEFSLALSEKLVLAESVRAKRNVPYFTDYVRKTLPDEISTETLSSEQISIHSGIDTEYQLCAENAVEQGLEELEKIYPVLKRAKDPAEIALLAVEPSSGTIIAWVGGRSYGQGQFDHVSLAKRQPGSTFKPFVYLTALDSSLNNYKVAKTTSLLLDQPVSFNIPGSGEWSPQNYDHKYRGEVTVRQALTNSLNIPTVNLARKVGVEKIARTAELFGFGRDLPKVPSLALGAGEVTPLELATAYNALANGGRLVNLRSILYANSKDDPLYQSRYTEKQVASEAAIYVLTTILQDVINKGTGTIVRKMGVTMPLAGKTGTSNDGKDSWFAGFSPHILAVTWMGYDDGKALNLTGASGAGRIWSRFMKCVEPMEPKLDFVAPAGVVSKKIDFVTGLVDNGYCPQERLIDEVFVEGTEPTEMSDCSTGIRRRDEDNEPQENPYELIGDIIKRIWGRR